MDASASVSTLVETETGETAQEEEGEEKEEGEGEAVGRQEEARLWTKARPRVRFFTHQARRVLVLCWWCWWWWGGAFFWGSYLVAWNGANAGGEAS